MNFLKMKARMIRVLTELFISSFCLFFQMLRQLGKCFAETFCRMGK